MKLITAQIDEILRRTEAGEPISALAREFGVTPVLIYYHRKRRGLPPLPRGGKGRGRPSRITADADGDLVGPDAEDDLDDPELPSGEDDGFEDDELL